MASRASWKGAISFGMVHIPVALYPATTASGVDFDWLDKRSMDLVGYQRINKKTGMQVISDDIAKAVAYGESSYVVLLDEEIDAATPQATQTIDIDSFVPLADIPMTYLERPYFMAPVDKSAKAYALLRSTLIATSKAALAQVVIHSKQHLAIVLASGPGLLLILLRWTENLRAWEDLGVELPPQDAQAAGLSKRDLTLARQWVEELSGPWNPAGFVDTFKRDILALVEQKASQGQLHAVPNGAARINQETDPDALPQSGMPANQPSSQVKGTANAKTKISRQVKAKTPAPAAAVKKRAKSDQSKG